MAMIQRAPEKLQAADAEQIQLVAAAAEEQGLKADQLIDFEIYWDKIAILVPTGQKFEYSLAYLAELVKSVVIDEEPAKKPARKARRTTTRK